MHHATFLREHPDTGTIGPDVDLKWTGERFRFETVPDRPFWEDISNEALWP
jgi:hypothetical protein